MSSESDSKRAVLLALTVCFPLVVALTTGVLYSYSPRLGGLGNMIGYFVLIIWSFFPVTMGLLSAVERKWRRSAVLFGAVASAWPLMTLSLFAGDYIHLAINYPSYRQSLESNSIRSDRPITFDWGGTGFGGIGNSSRALVYDTTDNLSRDLGTRETPASSGVWVRTRRLFGHFYTVETEW
jgi:hypothetical protein